MWWQPKDFFFEFATGNLPKLTGAYFSNGLVKNHQKEYPWVFCFFGGKTSYLENGQPG